MSLVHQESIPNIVYFFGISLCSDMKEIMICVACIDNRTMGTASCLCKRLNNPLYPSWFESVQLFCISEVEKMELKGDWYATISDIQTSVMTKNCVMQSRLVIPDKLVPVGYWAWGKDCLGLAPWWMVQCKFVPVLRCAVNFCFRYQHA